MATLSEGSSRPSLGNYFTDSFFWFRCLQVFYKVTSIDRSVDKSDCFFVDIEHTTLYQVSLLFCFMCCLSFFLVKVVTYNNYDDYCKTPSIFQSGHQCTFTICRMAQSEATSLAL